MPPSVMSRPAPARPLLILGPSPTAPDLALRRLLRAKLAGQALGIIDYQGVLARHLTPRNKGHMHKSPVLWCDLSNRRRPIALFRFQRTPGMKQALRAFLDLCVGAWSEPIASHAIDATVELAYRLAENGSVGLASLARSLQRPELARSVGRNGGQELDLERLVAMLDWMLRFPSVWALSEGNNRIDVARALAGGGILWIEMPAGHFERLEHTVVSWMVDAMLMDALLSRGHGTDEKLSPVILYGLPPNCPLPMATASGGAKHVGLFSFSGKQGLPVAARRWLEAGADCWIAGSLGQLPDSNHTDWLQDVERKRVQELEPGQVWVRSGLSGKAVTVLVRPHEATESVAASLRLQSLRCLKQSPIKQFSSAHARGEAPVAKNSDLFATMCAKETLYAGWFRVKTHNRRSHGSDQVTIEQFGSKLDTQLEHLAAELSEGRYRCRPLRTVRIPKADGDFRVIKIACVRDRVVQAACLQLIEPLFDARFSPTSFAYRPGRGAQHAIALARSSIRAGKVFALTADIRKCFDSIDHDILLRLVGDVIGDHDVIQLLRRWLTSDVIDFMDVIPAELGVHQGEAISPLLANIYLDPMDKEFERAGFTFVRYADDYLVLCNNDAEAQAALRLMGEFLRSVLRLELKPAKTHYSHIDMGVTFLGFVLDRTHARIPADKVAKTVQTIGEHLDYIASPDCGSMEKWQTATHMNALIRGFRNYFLIDNAPAIEEQLAAMDSAVLNLEGGRFASDAGLELIWSSREKLLPQRAAAQRSASAVAAIDVVPGAYLDAVPQADDSSIAPDAGSASEPHQSALKPRAETSGSTSADSDVLLLEGRLHVMTSGCYVTVSGDDLLVRQRKRQIFRAPICDVTMVYLEGKGIAISADLTMRLCEADIPVVFTPLIGIPSAVAQPVKSMRSHARQQQVLRRNEPEILSAGLKMLAAKVANQASVLKYFGKYKKRTGDAGYGELTRSADEIRAIAATLASLDPTAQGVRALGMGHEGRAAAKYWAAFATFVPGGLSFPGRHTRHATDPVNSSINYVYSLLYGEVWRAVIRAGLDPYFGIMHGTERDQGSLVFDLIEEFRAPFGDRLVIGMFGRGFVLELDQDGRLRASCRHKIVTAFYKQWARPTRSRGKQRTPAEILELQVARLKNTFLGKEDYEAFHFRW